jgi:electron transfer flavoprotein alpha subunit
VSEQDILVLAEIHRDALADITHELLAAARQLAAATGGQVVAVLLGDDGERHAAALGAADRILVVNDPQLAEFSPEQYVAVLEALVKAEQPRAVLVGSTTIGLDVGPTLGARLSVPVLVGCQSVAAQDGALSVISALCGGKILADVEVMASLAVLLILPGRFRPTDQRGSAKVETRPSPVPLMPGAIRFEQMILPTAGDVDITQQEVLVSVGRGIQQQDNMEVAEELAQALGGALACSRPIVDQGWLPLTRQVGKSGMVVKPKCFMALGISGAPEHVEGMKDSDLIIAVNTDPNAPIFDVAHYGVVADLLDVVPALTDALKRK